jgi:hypothetical protein
MGIAYLRKSSGDDSSAIAYAVGTGIGMVFLAAVGAEFYRRLSPGGRTIAAPLALALAAVVGFGVQVFLRERNHAEYADTSAGIASCPEQSPDPLSDPPRGIQMVELSPAEQASFAARIETSLPGWTGRYVARTVMVGGSKAGFAVAYPGITAVEDGVERFKAGALSTIDAGGGSVDEQVIGGESALVGSVPGMGMLAVTHDCWAVTIIGPNAAAVSGIGKALLSRGPTF